MRAEHAARQAGKKTEADRKEAEMNILRQAAEKAKKLELEKRSKALQKRGR